MVEQKKRPAVRLGFALGVTLGVAALIALAVIFKPAPPPMPEAKAAPAVAAAPQHVKAGLPHASKHALSNYFAARGIAVVPGATLDGRPSAHGSSTDKQTTVELIGEGDAVDSVWLLVNLSKADKKVRIRNVGILPELIRNATGWDDSHDWLEASITLGTGNIVHEGIVYSFDQFPDAKPVRDADGLYVLSFGKAH